MKPEDYYIFNPAIKGDLKKEEYTKTRYQLAIQNGLDIYQRSKTINAAQYIHNINATGSGLNYSIKKLQNPESWVKKEWNEQTIAYHIFQYLLQVEDATEKLAGLIFLAQNQFKYKSKE